MSDPTHYDSNGYLRWEYAGGPNECAHGYAEGIACPRCDAAGRRIMREIQVPQLTILHGPMKPV